MKSAWIKPNLMGALLFFSALFIALNLLPMPSFTYSAMSGRATVSWPGAWAGTALVLALLLYGLSMRLGAACPRQGAARMLTGPLLIIPQGLAIAISVALFIYEPPEIHGHLERHLFLQGNTDWGGGGLFAGIVAIYAAFGFTAAWHLALSLQDLPASVSFGRACLKSLGILQFHLLLFLVAGTAPWPYDARVTPNDFRNLFLFAAGVYACTLLWIVALRKVRLPMSARIALAPLFTVLWLILGSDGNTARAGQLVQAGQDPQPIVRGVRHGLMLSWHRLCDSTLGDIGKSGPGPSGP